MSENEKPKNLQEKMEKNVGAFLFFLVIALSVAGIVEIVPLFYLDSTFEHNACLRHYNILIYTAFFDVHV